MASYGTATSSSCLFQNLAQNERPEDRLQDTETQTGSLPGNLDRLASPPGSPSATRGPSPVGAPAVRETPRRCGQEAGAGRALPAPLPHSRGSEPREVTYMGQERFSFPVTALAGVADVLISGLRICLNYLHCA